MDKLNDLLTEYWDAAYAECAEGRDHDTADSRAQRALSALQEHYAAILARHNALREAAKNLRDTQMVLMQATRDFYTPKENMAHENALAAYRAARAEVDRLIADCKGEE